MKSDSKRLDAINADVSRQASLPEVADQQTTDEIDTAKQEAGLTPTEKGTLFMRRWIANLEQDRRQLSERLAKLEHEKDELQDRHRTLEVSNARLSELVDSRASYDWTAGIAILVGTVIMGGYQIAQLKDQVWIFAVGATLNGTGWLVSTVPAFRSLMRWLLHQIGRLFGGAPSDSSATGN